MPRPSHRERFLDAAAELIRDGGPLELTFDRLADVTGASKGGLLYHFATKRELVAALLDHTFDRFERDVEARTALDTRPFAWAHAYVDASLDVRVSRPELLAALVVEQVDSREVLHACRDRMSSWQAKMEADGLPRGVAAAIRYACDGWWAMAALDVGPVDDDRMALAEELHRRLDRAAASCVDRNADEVGRDPDGAGGDEDRGRPRHRDAGRDLDTVAARRAPRPQHGGR